MKFPNSAPAVLSLFVIGAALLAADKDPESPPLVNLNVLALDSQGQPVVDLRAEDFQILDNGKPRRIVWFHALPRKGPLTARSMASSQSVKQGTGEYSNRGVGASPATFILLDLFNADFAARGLSANEIMHALERLESADNVYLYLLTSAAKIFAIHAVVPAGAQHEANDGPWTRRVKPLLDEALRQVNALKSQDDRLPPLRIGPTWQALAGLVQQFAELPGPKSFIWITQGVENGFMEPGRLFQVDTGPLRAFAANLNALETAAYAVQQRPNGSLPPRNEGSPGDTLEQLSALTGGRVFPTDNTEQAITQAISNALRMNYRIAFLPDRLDGKYHKIRVTAARKDIKIQTADHYYAMALPGVAQREQAVEDAIAASPFEYPEIGLTVSAAQVEATPGQFRFAIHVDASDVMFLKEGARRKASFAVGLVEYESNGQASVVDGMPVDLDMSEEDYAKATTGGIEITRQARLDAKTRQVRVAVLDRNSNLAGTVTIPIR